MANEEGQRLDHPETMVSMQAYVDAQLTEMRHAIQLVAEAQAHVSVREHIEAILSEQRLNYTRRELELDRALTGLRTEIERAIREGDQGVRDFLGSEIRRLDLALEAAELLETQRCRELERMIEAAQREAQLIHEAAEAAIAKAEEQNRERWHGANEWRQHAADRDTTQQQEIVRLTATFLRQDTADARFDALRDQLIALSEKVNQVV